MTNSELELIYRAKLIETFRNFSNYQSFINASANLYKYTFPNQILLSGQIENPTAVATYNQWNSLGRRIKAGSVGAYAFEKNSTGFSKSFFDIRDTLGDKPIEIWQVNNLKSELHGASTVISGYHLKSFLAERHFEENNSYFECIIKKASFSSLSEELENPFISDIKKDSLIDFMDESIQQIVLNRCFNINNNHSDKIEALYHYNEIAKLSEKLNTITKIGLTISKLSRELLSVLERGIKSEHRIYSELEHLTTRENNRWNPLSAGYRDSDLSSDGELTYGIDRKIRNDDDGNTGRILPNTIPSSIGERRNEQLFENNGQRMFSTFGGHTEDNKADEDLSKNEFIGESADAQPDTNKRRREDKYNNRKENSIDSEPIKITETHDSPTLKALLSMPNMGKSEIEISSSNLGSNELSELLSQEKQTKLYPEAKEDISEPEIKEDKSPPFEDDLQISLLEANHTESKQQEKPVDIEDSTDQKILKGRKNFYLFNNPNINTDFSTGAKKRFSDNIKALRVLNEVETKNEISKEQQQALYLYAGWGGLPEAFDGSNSSWAEEYTELKTLLNTDDYQSAKASTLTSFFTPKVYIESIYKALENFNMPVNAKILEPSLATGRFFSAISEKYTRCTLVGIEIDAISTRISKSLYPDAYIHHAGYQDVKYPDNYFDVVVGNVPFGNYTVFDATYNKNGFYIHDYFFMKSIEQVRAGGIVAFITSSGTLDKEDARMRKLLSEKAELIGAIRLPDNAFVTAGTKVTTDIIFLQKKGKPTSYSDVYPSWVNLATDDSGIKYNQYFIDHPEMMLGTAEMVSSPFGEKFACKAYKEEELSNLLEVAISQMSADIPLYEHQEKEESPLRPTNVKAYTFHMLMENGEDKVYYADAINLKYRNMNKTAIQRIKGMCKLRDITRELIKSQLSPSSSDTSITDLQKELNFEYDNYIKKYGFLSLSANSRLFAEDVDCQFLLALEKVDEENKENILKEDIFFKRTVSPIKEITSADTAHDAMYIILSQKGKLDLVAISNIYLKSVEEIISELGENIYHNPRKTTDEPYSGWEISEEYLSGNIRKKISVIDSLIQNGQTEYIRNKTALQSVLPKQLEAGDINVRIGATWIDEKYYTEFMWETFKTPFWQKEKIQASYNPYLNQWNITNKASDFGIQAREVYGTKRANAYLIFEKSLNLNSITVYDRIDEKSFVNSTETKLARGKQNQIENAFKGWVFNEPERRNSLVEKYNSIFNSVKLRKYDGSHLKLPNLSETFKPYSHQKNAVARICDNTYSTLLDHEVGTGKTATMIMGAMERIRLGLSKRVVIPVPNHIVPQFTATIYKLYPMSKAMMAREKDFEKTNRQNFLSRIAMSDVEIVVMGHTQFERLGLSTEHKSEMLEAEISEIITAIERQKEKSGERLTIKQMERTHQSLKEKLKQLHEDTIKENMITFEELGFDTLIVDEVDLFKNCRIHTKLYNVAGIGTADSKRAADMLMKIRYIDEIGGKFVSGTGTPISNAVSEMYVMQRYHQENFLKSQGIFHFDQWVSTFAETTTSLEPAPEGNGLRSKTRLSKYFNLPELMNMYGMFADVVTAEETEIIRPQIKTGLPITIVNQPSDCQKMWMAMAVSRCNDIRKRLVSPQVDNMLKFSHEAKLLSLDERLVDSSLPFSPSGKIAHLIKGVTEIYHEKQAILGTQIIFCDMSTPKKEAFNLYDDIKKRLIENGIPEDDIVFIHDAKNNQQKELIFEDMRNGVKRILLASTEKCGAGTNIQDRLYAIHHIDAPYRPRDITQRNGRGHRQGNINPEIEIRQYVTENTFDAYSWSILKRKQEFIQQIRKGAIGQRSFEDKDTELLNFETVQAIATGNPLIIEKMEVDNEVSRLDFLLADYNNQRYRLQDKLNIDFPKKEKEISNTIKLLENDVNTIHKFKDNSFSITIDGEYLDERTKAGQTIIGKLQQYYSNTSLQKETLPIGTFKDLQISIEQSSFANVGYLKIGGSKVYICEINPDSDIGTITRLENTVDKIPLLLQEEKNNLADIQSSIKSAKEELDRPFAFQTQLCGLLKHQAKLDAELSISDDNDLIIEESKQSLENEADLGV